MVKSTAQNIEGAEAPDLQGVSLSLVKGPWGHGFRVSMGPRVICGEIDPDWTREEALRIGDSHLRVVRGILGRPAGREAAACQK